MRLLRSLSAKSLRFDIAKGVVEVMLKCVDRFWDTDKSSTL